VSNELPFFKFFPSDWLSDEKLRLCSRAARGTWQDLLCLMWKASRRGYLELGQGVPLSCDQLARVVGCKSKEIAQDLSELEAAGVFSREPETGVIYSRRLVRDAKHREVSSLGGSVTSEAKAQAVRLNGTKGGRPKLPQNNLTENLSETKPEEPKQPNPQKVRGSEGQNTDNTNTPIPPSGFVLELGPTDLEIYEAYPRKQKRADALKAIRKAVAFGHPPSLLLERSQAYFTAVQKWGTNDRTFVPHPATWFNSESFLDDPQTWLPKSNAVSYQRDSHASDHSKGF